MSAGTTTRILGIDPGSRLTGFGVIETTAGKCRALAYDVIKLGDGPLAERLLLVLQRLRALCAEHRPDEVAMEQVFVKRNVSSALILGQARGAAICAIAEAGLPLHEYAPASIKLAIAGSGRAEKAQMQHMVKVLLNLPSKPAEDAADALACALCHAHSRTMILKTNKMLQGKGFPGRGR
ncbi:MAG TPA: crossover junction endodeoxyribonuclease RuvC [Verrucomicrobiae bacterium]|nr:crossover junction endodeoxyribonuclease RuvC [Verrucomicrobiae bacterium]